MKTFTANGKCQWFLLCDNPATLTMPHPFGPVPICQRCADKVERLSKPREESK